MLKVISRSTFDLQAVLDTLVEVGSSTVRSRPCMIISARRRGSIAGRRLRAFQPSPRITSDICTVEPGRGHVVGRALLEGQVVHIPDVQTDPEYTGREAQKLGGYRTMLGVPLLREGAPIGVFDADTH